MAEAEIIKEPKTKISAWLMILLVLGGLSLGFGTIIANTADTNFPAEDDDAYDRAKHEQSDEDLSVLQFLIGAVFMNFGIGLIVIFMFLGIVANNTIHRKARIALLIASVILLMLWVYFALLAGLLSKLTWLAPPAA